MNDQQLDRNLRSVGMGCFLTYFNQFADPSIDAAALLMKETDYTDKSCRSRTSHARAIIRAGRARDALETITRASRVHLQVTDRAKELLNANFLT